MPRKHEFIPLVLPLMEIVGRTPTLYRVYENQQKYVEVNAETAHEAMHKSGIKRVYKILHQGSVLENVLKRSTLKRHPSEVAGDNP